MKRPAKSPPADATAKPATNGAIETGPAPAPNPVSREALWLWGRLRDFERDGLLERTPQEVMFSMTPSMRNELHELAPRVAAWLKQIGAL